MKTMLFAVTVVSSKGQYTAYEGLSPKRAAEAVDAARAVLVMGGGTAAVYVGDAQANRTERLAWLVTVGSATSGPAAVAVEVKANRPSYKAVLAYARIAVKSEVEHPASNWGGYDHQAVQHDVLNHFEGLTNSDEDEDFINEAISEASRTDFPDLDL